LFSMRSPRARQHGSGRRQPSTRKYEDDDGYSAYDSDRRTPYSEYEKSRTNGKRTVFSEYTTDADYTEEDRSSYSESDNGKRTPYSEYITEYSDETDDDRMSGTLGIARNQYCTTLNALVEGSESSSSESSYSQSTFASDFDRMCNANVNTNCMATLFNRNTDVPGTIHCGGEHSEAQQKVSLPLPLHYMDHLVPSKQEFNSALDNFAQKFDTGDEERPGFPQVYKSLFEANLSQTASDEDEERVADYVPRRKGGTERNRAQELGFAKPKRDALPKVEKEKDADILSPPSHIIIKDDFTAVSSAESFGFAPETQKTSSGAKHKKDRREGNNRHSSPRHSSPRHAVPPRPSPRHAAPHRPSPRHSSPERPSPRHSSPRHTVEKNKHEHSSTKVDAPAATRHGLDRLMRKQATSPSKSRNVGEEETPAFKGEAGVKSPLSGGKVSKNGKSNAFSFRHMDESRQDADASEQRKSNPRREGTISRINTTSQLQSKMHQQPDRRDPDGPVEEESPSFDERLVPIKASISKAKASRIENQLMMNSNPAPHPSGNKTSLMKDERNGMAGALDANAPLWRNPANSIPHVLSLKQTQTAVSELTGAADDFGETKRDSTPLETIVASPRGDGGVNVQVLSLKPTQTAVSELTGDAGDFGEIGGYSLPIDTIIGSPRGNEIPPTKKGVWKSNNATPKESAYAESSLHGSVVARRATPNKKAETLDKLEDALMGSTKSFSSDHNKSKRQGFNKAQVFAVDKSSRSDARLTMDNPGTGDIGNAKQQPESKMMMAEVEETTKPSHDIKSKPKELELDDTTLTRQVEPFEATKMTLESMEQKKPEEEFDTPSGREKGDRNVRTETIQGGATNKARSLYPESFSDYYKDLSGNNDRISEDHDGVHGDKAMQKLEGDDPTSLSALDNEISLLESQITGLEQQDQISEIHNDQMTAASHHFEPPVIESEEALMSIIGATKMSDDNTRLQSSVNPSRPSSIPPETDRKTSGNYRHFKPPLVPTEQGPMSNGGKKQNNSSSSKPLAKQIKSTDATLVTAPTVMTMDTPFTMEAPLVLSPTVKGPEERKWNRNSSMLVATAIALPSETGSSDGTEIDAPFFFVFIVGTRKYFSDMLFIIVAWLRHLSSVGFVQRQQGRVQVGLMVPPIAEDDVLHEQQLQTKSLVNSRLPCPTSEEPGIVVESFVPEMWAENESAGGKRGALLPPSASNSIWSRLFRKKEIVAATQWGTGVQ